MVTPDAAIASLDEARVWRALATVSDPELPFLSVIDLGIVREVSLANGVVVITPTYSGCPATEVIGLAIATTLAENNLDLRVEIRLAPAWTTDWITVAGREKLRAHGIAPPPQAVADKRALFAEPPAIACPRCGSLDTERVSAFGATACKALYRCRACREPFEAFKCL
ncbi:MAG: phenylacetate-CoA oxygenase subunit PaaJ [Alphaproteobacteria bacterium]|nr:phenylacetate-CoA oxygenase subunit PaaJ [Alphaproteobacteria bacterium]MCB9928041.1 phenylacetate-CoA oxygenase subunit PaaJ [Alphaproteobacteria bacterium]